MTSRITPYLGYEDGDAAIDFLVIGSALETYTAGFTRPPSEYRPAYPALADSLEAAGQA